MVIIKKDYGIKDKEFSLFFIDVITMTYFFLCDLKFKKLKIFSEPSEPTGSIPFISHIYKTKKTSLSLVLVW